MSDEYFCHCFKNLNKKHVPINYFFHCRKWLQVTSHLGMFEVILTGIWPMISRITDQPGQQPGQELTRWSTIPDKKYSLLWFFILLKCFLFLILTTNRNWIQLAIMIIIILFAFKFNCGILISVKNYFFQVCKSDFFRSKM